MSERTIVERLRERHAKRENPDAWQEVICAYEEERDEAADEIERLIDQLSTVHASASDVEYSQWERITELEEALDEILREFGKPIHDQSVDGGASYKQACEVVNRARATLYPVGKETRKADCLH